MTFMQFKDLILKPQYRLARIIHIRDDVEEYGSFRPGINGAVPKGWGWILGYHIDHSSLQVNESKELFVRIF